ncbi:MAG: hypothetical protein O7E51_11795, partial [Acidobacteria bacterium]|nr:hypothetical protein [Acidobacteriota bacterium]
MGMIYFDCLRRKIAHFGSWPIQPVKSKLLFPAHRFIFWGTKKSPEASGLFRNCCFGYRLRVGLNTGSPLCIFGTKARSKA